MSPLVLETSHGVHFCHPVTLLYVKQDHFRPGNTSVSKVKSQFQSRKLKTRRKCSILSERTHLPQTCFPILHPCTSSQRTWQKNCGCIMCCHLGPTNWWFNAKMTEQPRNLMLETNFTLELREQVIPCGNFKQQFGITLIWSLIS